MRKVVVTEGVRMPNGMTILPDALRVEDEQIPVSVGPSWSIENLLGWAKDFERNEVTHEISFDIQWLEEVTEEAREFYDSEMFDPSLYCTHVEEEPRSVNNRIVSKARIRQISLIPNAAYPVGHNPGAKLDG